MGEEKRVKDIMNPIDEYRTVDVDARLCDALAILKKNHESTEKDGTYHKTLLVTDASQKIVGKLTMVDLIRGLVPENSKRPELFSARAFSSRALEATDQVSEFQEHFLWLHSSFAELVKQEAHKRVGDIMSDAHPLLKEDDKINLSIYVLFKEGVRQQLVERDGKIVGVINLILLYNEFMETVGPECHVEWE
ncbi:MAG: CBS domain-containing protein [Pseudomonadota bacterium]